GATEPASTLSSVVFPAPFGPTTPTASSAPTVKSTPSRTTSSPKRLTTPVACRTGGPATPTEGGASSCIRLEGTGDRDLEVAGVLAQHEVQRERAAAGGHPLPADDRGGDDVRHRPLAPGEVAQRGVDL